ncbi:hypothetical protein HAX54_016982 [Datura stramonium]|uniref:Uncharacterized protein n=1 Tax=Datura stramonium TaxID=4076 RepID=A0ABS8Y4B5_DATST|nr:hypothetical protein [Datura stramonium]
MFGLKSVKKWGKGWYKNFITHRVLYEREMDEHYLRKNFPHIHEEIEEMGLNQVLQDLQPVHVNVVLELYPNMHSHSFSHYQERAIVSDVPLGVNRTSLCTLLGVPNHPIEPLNDFIEQLDYKAMIDLFCIPRSLHQRASWEKASMIYFFIIERPINIGYLMLKEIHRVYDARVKSLPFGNTLTALVMRRSTDTFEPRGDRAGMDCIELDTHFSLLLITNNILGEGAKLPKNEEVNTHDMMSSTLDRGKDEESNASYDDDAVDNDDDKENESSDGGYDIDMLTSNRP